MTFNPVHCGLYFTDAQVQQARKHKKRAPLNAAWDALLADNIGDKTPLGELLWLALCFRFNADVAAGEQAVVVLTLPETSVSRADVLLLAQAVELLRDHPAFTQAAQAAWFDALRTYIAACPPGDDLPSRAAMAALYSAAGVVLEDGSIFAQGENLFRQIIDTDLHPEGYFPVVMEGRGGQESDYLIAQLQIVSHLVQTAEIAAHVGVDLWHYEQRGISVLTAATYPLYYYFYPEKWPWNGDAYKPSEGITQEEAQAIFKRYLGFLEMINGRYDHPLKAVQMILDEVRPVFDPYGGGATTLSHARPKRGLFG